MTTHFYPPSRLTSYLLAPAALAALAAGATAAPLPQATDRYLDDSKTVVALRNNGPAYRATVSTVLVGSVGDSDAIKLDWVARGKTLSSKRCEHHRVRANGPVDGYYQVTCESDAKANLTAAGDIEARLIYIDDQADKELLLRTFKVKVTKSAWMNEPEFQIFHDDHLGLAYAVEAYPTEKPDDLDRLYFTFWMATNKTFDGQLRCSVDGKRLPDYAVEIQRAAGVDLRTHVKNVEKEYAWSRMVIWSSNLRTGTRKELLARRPEYKAADLDEAAAGKANEYVPRPIGDTPGAWTCDLRFEGKVMRKLSFSVDDTGHVVRPAAQTAAGFPTLPPLVSLVKIEIPAKNDFDLRLRPDAIKKSMPYGASWPKDPWFDALKKSLPPASGLADP